MAVSFKELIRQDIGNVFLNLDEFGQEHMIDGKPMVAIIDDMEHIEREKRLNQHMDGLFVKQVLLYVRAADFGPMPKTGRLIKLDGRDYRITDAIDEDGLYSITMEANRS